MREFVYYSKTAVTAGNLIREDLMKAGRLDIACQFILQCLFVSRHIREDVKVHLIFNGPPDSPKHLEISPADHPGGINNKIDISKKDIAGLIKRMLYKYQKGKKVSIAPGYYIEKKSFTKLLEEFQKERKDIYLLDKRGKDIRDIKFKEDSVFILGDHEGIPKQELKWIKHLGLSKISVGPQMLFSSQVVTLIHNELDRKL